MDQYFSVN